MENEKTETRIEKKEKFNFEKFHDKYYKLIFLIPIVLLLISFVYVIQVYSSTGDFIYRDVSLSGGTTITLKGDIDQAKLELGLKDKFPGTSFTKLTDLTTRRLIALIIESSATSEQLKPEIEKILGYTLNEDNSSIEFTGSSLSENFYKQLIIALIISFILMSIVIFLLFRTFIPSLAVIFAVFADIIMPLALIDYFGMRVSAAGIAAFLMLVGYSVDTDILLTTRVLKTSEGSLNHRIYRSFKTGILMTATALTAVLPAFFLITALPDSFRQIFLILGLGLLADILNTWVTNVGIIKWYCEKKGIK
ncbi:MAG: MMPL family transporter [Nanoarchaeota archaeon]